MQYLPSAVLLLLLLISTSTPVAWGQFGNPQQLQQRLRSQQQQQQQHRNLQQAEGGSMLGQCQGDCNNDFDCAGDLVCLHRSGNESVPVCSGTPQNAIDYCVTAQQRFDIQGATRIKMYWQADYYWQGETYDRKFCMHCENNVCGNTGVHNNIIECEYVGRTVALVIDRVSPAEPYFRIRVGGTQWCLEMTDDRNKYGVYMDCNATSDNQLWYGQNGDPFNGMGPFEIIPKTKPEFCLTITHQPSRNESTWVSTCPWARSNKASLWMKYF